MPANPRILVTPHTLQQTWYKECESFAHKKLQFYQRTAVNHSIDPTNEAKGYLIWHEMGTGKTLTGLTFLKRYRVPGAPPRNSRSSSSVTVVDCSKKVNVKL